MHAITRLIGNRHEINCLRVNFYKARFELKDNVKKFEKAVTSYAIILGQKTFFSIIILVF